MRKFILWAILTPTLPALFFLFTGCGDDPASPPRDLPAGVMSVELPAIATAFSTVFDQIGHPRHTVSGPFELRGYNKHYNFELSAMLVTLDITNHGTDRPGEPVTLTVRGILPRGVVLVGPPAEQPVYTFEFGDGDGVWSANETSAPVTLAFGITPDRDLTFVAELAAGFGPQSGLISGTVWRDDDRDGERGAAEPGAGGLAVDLYAGASNLDPAPRLLRTVSGPSGEFAFGNLAAGAYHLRIETRPYLTHTTGTLREVILVADDLGVVPADSVDFGLLAIAVDTLAVTATADATIRADVSARMNDNHGADPYLAVGTTRSSGPNDAIRGLVRFDLGLVERPVLAAYLEIAVARFRDGSNQTYQLDLNPITPSGDRTPWIEGNGTEVGPPPPGVVWVDEAYGVAWLGHADGGDANNQSQPDFRATAAATATVVQNEHQAGDIISWDVTDLVNQWLDGSLPNHGLVIRDVNPGGTFRQLWFWSRDALERGYGISGAQPGPHLVLLYE